VSATGTDSAPADVAHRDRRWWTATWPLDRRDLLALAGWWLLVVAVASGLGRLVTDSLAPNAVTDADERAIARLADGRTPTRTDLADWGSMLAETMVKVVVTTVFALLMLWLWRRWREASVVVVSLVFEASAFVVVSYVVSRPRPAQHMLDSPVDTSFPSGHVAAAAAYAAVVVVVFWHARSRSVRALAVAVCALVIGVVAWARMYLGMHHPTDVVVGAILGLVSVAVCRRVIGPPDASVDEASPRRQHDDPAGDDVTTPAPLPPSAPPTARTGPARTAR
jgi:membrane-associated phospholipid phosphatase